MENIQADKCCKGHGGKIAVVVLLILAITAITIVSIIRDRIVNYPQWQVSVTGQGKVAYVSDIANVTLGVQIDKAAKAEDALDQLNVRVNKIIAAVKALKIEDADIQTMNYSLYPQYDYENTVSINGGSTESKQIVSGYNANQQLVIKVRGIDSDKNKVSQVIAAAAKAGSNQVLGIGFEPSNLEDLKQQARLKAINDAKNKAGGLAMAAGVDLKEVVGWWESIIQVPGINNQVYYDGKGGMGGGGISMPNIPGGSQEIIMEVSLNYRIK